LLTTYGLDHEELPLGKNSGAFLLDRDEYKMPMKKSGHAGLTDAQS